MKQVEAAASRPADQAQEHLAPLVLAHCWHESICERNLDLEVKSGQSIADRLLQLNMTGWNPDWLFEAGYRAIDAAGCILATSHDPASVSGLLTWQPSVPLFRADDETKDDKAPGSAEANRRLAGEVLLTSLRRRAAQGVGVRDSSVARGLNGNTRGARFRQAIKAALSAQLPMVVSAREAAIEDLQLTPSSGCWRPEQRHPRP